MRSGFLAAQGQAWRLLRANPALWLPAWLLDACFLLFAGALLKVWATQFSVTGGPRWPAGILVSFGAVLLAWVVLDAAWLQVSDRALGAAPVRWRDWLEVRPRAAARLLGGRLLLLAADWLIWAAGLLVFLTLLSGADELTLRRLGAGGGLPEVYGAWARRGGLWLVGTMLLLAGCGALREMIRAALLFWRAALVSEGGGLTTAVRQAIRFGSGRGWDMLGRQIVRFLTGGAAILGPVAGAALLAAVWVETPEGWATTRGLGLALLRAMTWLAVVTLLAAARVWLNLGDLVFYRLDGGADQRAELLTGGVRPPRSRRELAVPPGRLVVASEPAQATDVWEPGPVSEPV